MYLLYCDETNLVEKKGTFFVYGGVAVSSKKIEGLSNRIDDLRTEYEIDKDFTFKFNPGPKHLKHSEFSELKGKVLDSISEFDCKLFTSFILHDIAKNPDEARRNEINRICYHFQCFLNRVKKPGLVIIDRFEDKKIDHHLREKFSTGLKGMPYSNEIELNRIMGFHYSAIGQSNMCSVVDIVMGSLRFAVNAHSGEDEKHKETAEKLIKKIAPAYFREKDKKYVSEIGLFFSPKIIRVDDYREKYINLKSFLRECGLKAEQKITNEREY